MLSFTVDNPEDNSYKPNVDFVDNDIDVFVEEIKLIFGTSKDDILGGSDIDADLEKYVWKNAINVNVDMISSRVMNIISTHSLLADDFNFTVESKFASGTERDVVIIFIDVKLRHNSSVKRIVSITIT